MPESQLQRALDIHHINYDKNDHRAVNVLGLCKTCHGVTNFQRSEWEATLSKQARNRTSLEIANLFSLATQKGLGASSNLTFIVVGECLSPQIEAGSTVNGTFVGTRLSETTELHGTDVVVYVFNDRSPRILYLGRVATLKRIGTDPLLLARVGDVAGPEVFCGYVHAGLDIWFPDDVKRILASTHEAMRATSEALAVSHDGAMAEYRQGYEDALRAVALAFGLLLSERALLAGNEHLRVWNGGRE